MAAALATGGASQPGFSATQPLVRRAVVQPAQCGCPVTARTVTPASLSQQDPEAKASFALVNRICADVAKLPRNAAVTDLEAAIVYAISQSGLSDKQALLAFRMMVGCDYGQRNFSAAVARVRGSLARGGFQRGTAGLAGRAVDNSSFVSPSINVGGGSSNYVQ